MSQGHPDDRQSPNHIGAKHQERAQDRKEKSKKRGSARGSRIFLRQEEDGSYHKKEIIQAKIDAGAVKRWENNITTEQRGTKKRLVASQGMIINGDRQEKTDNSNRYGKSSLARRSASNMKS